MIIECGSACRHPGSLPIKGMGTERSKLMTLSHAYLVHLNLRLAPGCSCYKVCSGHQMSAVLLISWRIPLAARDDACGNISI